MRKVASGSRLILDQATWNKYLKNINTAIHPLRQLSIGVNPGMILILHVQFSAYIYLAYVHYGVLCLESAVKHGITSD